MINQKNNSIAKIKVEKLKTGYNRKIILSDVTFTLHSGEIITVIGPNGAGKTTLLKTIAKQLSPISGTIYLDKKQIQDYPYRDFAQKISYMQTSHQEPEFITCKEAVLTGRYPYTGIMGVLSVQDKKVAEEAMEFMHITDLQNYDISQISDGQKQRVLLARAICQEPEVLILDEPTSFLDIRHKLEFLNLIQNLAHKRQITVLLSLHELDLAQKISDQVICLKNNRLDRYGTPEEIFTNDYIQELYQLSCGSYNERFGSVEFPAPNTKPQIFVIGGGGNATTIYRLLQKQQQSFITGILYENDIDYETAKSLASQVFSTPAFEPVSQRTIENALESLMQCPKVICCLKEFGTYNQANKILFLQANLEKKLITLSSFF